MNNSPSAARRGALREGEAPAEPEWHVQRRLGGSLALPHEQSERFFSTSEGSISRGSRYSNLAQTSVCICGSIPARAL